MLRKLKNKFNVNDQELNDKPKFQYIKSRENAMDKKIREENFRSS